MLILFNGEIMQNVSLKTNRDNSQTYLEYKGWNYRSSSTNNHKQNRVPYVSFPDSLKDGIWTNCNVGYIDLNTMEIFSSEITLEYIIINSIKVRRQSGTGGLPTRNGHYVDINYSEYFYKIELTLFDKDYKNRETDIYPYTIESYDIIWKGFDNKEGWLKKYSSTINYLFVEFPEKIRKYLEGEEHEHYFFKRPLSLINVDYLQHGWPMKGKILIPTLSCVTASHEYLFDRNNRLNLPFTLEKALLTLLTINVEKKDNDIVVKFCGSELSYLNIYFARIFEFAFNQKLLYNRLERVAYCHLKEEIPYNLNFEDDIAAYIACVMHLYLYRYFDLEASRQLYMVCIPEDYKEYYEISTYLTNMQKIVIDESFYDIYRLVFCCNIEHKQIGQNRVGRDDHESRYKSYEFRPRKGHKMSQRVISKINLLLETKLEYQEEKSGWDAHPERYYYSNCYSSEYFYGSAESCDLGSAELKESSFIFVSNYFIMEYLTDKEDFKRFL